MSTHVELDGLADLLAGEGSDADLAHLSTCAQCSARLAELDEASVVVAAELAALPPVAPPADLEQRLLAALSAEPVPERPEPPAAPLRALQDEDEDDAPPAGQHVGQRDPQPLVVRRPDRRRVPLLPIAAGVAALLALGGIGVGLARSGGSDSSTTASSGSADSAAGAAAAPRAAVQNDSGTDYPRDPAALAAALPLLLHGGAPRAATAQRTPRPLARLHTASGLAGCLAALGPTAPLAVDYGALAGTPALVVVQPGPTPAQVTVVAVGAGCAPGAPHVLYRTVLSRPSG